MARFEDVSVGKLRCNSGAGSPATAGIKAEELGAGVVRKTVLKLSNTPITLTDVAGTCQYGSIKLYDFPQCGMQTLGARVVGALTASSLVATFGGVFSLGSAVAAGDATLTSTEADFLPSKTITTAVANVAAFSGVTIAAPATVYWDGSSTAKDLYLNVAITDNASSAAGTGYFTGIVEVFWISFGDI